MGYVNTLFDTSRVHSIDIIMDDWDEFTASCKSEEYHACTVVIDNKSYKNVAIRGKGNTSLTQVESYGNNRYSFKIEFDHYDSTNTYYGLDKLCLNNIIQDNTYMKDYLTYQMMNKMGVASPLCSYVYITVNGEDWGLYLAVEGVEESFLQRNYGKNYGELYKPDSMNMGGGRGNGEKFDMDTFPDNFASEGAENGQTPGDDANSAFPPMPDKNTGSSGNDQKPDSFPNADQGGFGSGQMPGGMTPPVGDGSNSFGGGMPGAMTPPEGFEVPDGMELPDGVPGSMPAGIGGMNNGSDDVLLKYTDDDIDSYPNIFENAKTDITEADKLRLIRALKNLSNGENLSDTVDIDAVIRYFVVHNFVLNFDSYTGSMIHNYYLYESNGQMQMIPWDYNLAFGGFMSMGSATSLVNYPIDSPVSGGNTEDRPMIAWIFANEEYTELYHRYFSEFLSEYFTDGYFEEMIDTVFSMISPYVEKDPTKFCTYEEFEQGITTLRQFCLLRAQSISGQLNGTIGATSETQENETLIDAGDFQISDMGSMGNMGGGKNKFDGNMQNPQTGSDTEDNTAIPQKPSGDSESAGSDIPAGSTDRPIPGGDMQDGQISGGPDSGQIPNGNRGTPPVPPDFANGENGQQGDFNDNQMQKTDRNGQSNNNGMMQPQSQNTISTGSLIVMGISVLVLALGLAFAAIFKRRRYK